MAKLCLCIRAKLDDESSMSHVLFVPALYRANVAALRKEAFLVAEEGTGEKARVHA